MQEQGRLLWEPPAAFRERTHMAALMADRGAGDYAELWRWSVEDPEAFWAEIWRRFEAGGDFDRALAEPRCPAPCGARARRSLRRARLFRGEPTTARRSSTPRSCASSES